MNQLYIALTKEPVFNSEIKANLYVRGIFKSTTNILKQDKTLKYISDCKLPFEITSGLGPNTAYVAQFNIDKNCKKIYVLQVTLADVRNSYNFVICNQSEYDLLDIATEWFEDESQDTSSGAINDMLDNLKTRGFHDFYGYSKECGFLMYYFDLESELND